MHLAEVRLIGAQGVARIEQAVLAYRQIIREWCQP